MPEAFEVHRTLLAKGPLNLWRAFAERTAERIDRLEDAAWWYGLDAALEAAGVDDPPSNVTGRWLALLEAITGRLPPGRRADELRAIVAALGEVANASDMGGQVDLWGQAAANLAAAAPGWNVGLDTLHDRHWVEIRRWLAEEMAALSGTSSPHLRSRNPREPSGFHPRDFERLRDELGRTGLVVVAGPPGTGKTELALAYLERSLQQEVYDRAFWIRADHPSRLEDDFLHAARIIVDDPRAPASEARRRAFEYLEREQRWLLVFDGVDDPARLLPWVPRSAFGHVLCTSVIAAEDSPTGASPKDDTGSEERGPWSRYFNVETSFTLPALDDEAVRDMLPLRPPGTEAPSAEDVARLRSLTESSRLALMLSARLMESKGLTLPALLTKLEERRGMLERLVDEAGTDARTLEGSRRRAAERLLDELGGDLRPGTVAASLMIEHLGEIDSSTGSLGPEAVKLLARLQWFSGGSIPAPALTHALTPSNPIDDPRLVLLDDFGLAAAMRLHPENPSFEIHQDVRAAVALRERSPAREDKHLVEAGKTALVQLSSTGDLDRGVLTPGIEGGSLVFEALPHVARIAKALRDPPTEIIRPISAVELYVRAAARYWTSGFASAADRQIRHAVRTIDECAEAIDAILVAGGEDWAPVSAELDLAPPGSRLWGQIVLLRAAGYLDGSIRLFESVRRHLDSSLLQHCPRDHARLVFEGALSIRDRGAPSDQNLVGAADVEVAADLLRDAEESWRSQLTAPRDEPLDEAERDDLLRWIAASEMMLGVCASDLDHDVEAEAVYDVVVREREELIARADERGDEGARLDLMAELGRVFRFRGRSRYYQGRVEEAEADFKASVVWWEAAQPRTMNLASARSDRALMRAHLGEPDSVEMARRALAEAEAVLDPAHPKTGLVRMNLAEVLARTGHEVEAAAQARQASWAIGRYWHPEHPLFLRLRRSQAEIARGVARLDEAARTLVDVLEVESKLLPMATGEAATVTRSLKDRGRTWLSLSRVLLDQVASVEVGEGLRSSPSRRPGDEQQALDLAVGCLELAHPYITHTTPSVVVDGGHDPSPESIRWSLGLAEIALRRGITPPASLLDQLTTIGARRSQAVSASSGSAKRPSQRPVAAAAMAKELRIRLLAGEDPQRLLQALDDVKDACGWPTFPLRVADRVEVALASCSIRRRLPHSPAGGRTLYFDARADVDEAIRSLRESQEPPHSLIALSYAALALVAGDVVGARQKARNERERDRYRVVLSREVIAMIEKAMVREDRFQRNMYGIDRRPLLVGGAIDLDDADQL